MFRLFCLFGWLFVSAFVSLDICSFVWMLVDTGVWLFPLFCISVSQLVEVSVCYYYIILVFVSFYLFGCFLYVCFNVPVGKFRDFSVISVWLFVSLFNRSFVNSFVRFICLFLHFYVYSPFPQWYQTVRLMAYSFHDDKRKQQLNIFEILKWDVIISYVPPKITFICQTFFMCAF